MNRYRWIRNPVHQLNERDIPGAAPWCPMVPGVIPWCPMVPGVIPWCPMVPGVIPWCPMVPGAIQCCVNFSVEISNKVGYYNSMDQVLELIIYAVIVTIFLSLFYFLIINPHLRKKEYKLSKYQKDQHGIQHKKQGNGIRTCPVCNQGLETGMRIHSKLVRSSSGGQYMHIYGCPYCWPENTTYQRVCPVCQKTVPKNGFLVARYYEKRGARHVHVIGCSGCRRA